MQENPINKKYKYIKSLGHGGCGAVFLAENIRLGNFWAIKEIPRDQSISISAYIEPEILKRLNHPALPRICDVYEDDKKIYIIEDYIEGVCLKEELERKGRFEEKIVIDWGIQLCSVISYLHGQKPNPIIYGDMKPHNIIITSEGFIKLIDFGISSVLRDSETGNERGSPVQCETTFIGTKGYAAPEQYTGAGICQATDIYSLGITLIQLVTGIDPLISIKAYCDATFKDCMSEGLFRILRKCIEINPEARYQSTAMLMWELQDICLHRPKDSLHINTEPETLPFARIIAFTGARGAGVSTITASIAEHIARGPTRACIVDLSFSCTLEKSLPVKTDDSEECIPRKINSNLYYINLSSKVNSKNDIHQNPLILSNELSRLQNRFSYILIDTDLTVLNSISQYISKIFLVCDMNPYSISLLGKRIASEALTSELLSGSILIMNKFYREELGSNKIIQSLYADLKTEEHIQTLEFSRIFEVPYDHRIYIRWMYSFFGEPFRIANLFSEKYGNAISDIVKHTIYHKKIQKQAWLRQILGV